MVYQTITKSRVSAPSAFLVLTVLVTSVMLLGGFSTLAAVSLVNLENLYKGEPLKYESYKFLELGEYGVIYNFEYKARDLKKQWQRIEYKNYNWPEVPVVIAKPLSFNGNQPAHIRLRNIDNLGFEIMIEEWAYLDKAHNPETVSVLVLRPGTWEDSASGLKMEAGILQGVNQDWKEILLNESFTDKNPIIFTQAQTYNGTDPIVTRNKIVDLESTTTPAVLPPLGQDLVGSCLNEELDNLRCVYFDESHGGPEIWTQKCNGSAWVNMEACLDSCSDGICTESVILKTSTFNVKVQEEEGKDSIHADETIGYVVFSKVAGQLFDSAQNRNYKMEVGTIDDVNNNFKTIPFQNYYHSAPFFIADMQTINEADPAGIRYKNLVSESVEIKIEEEQSTDRETEHVNETVGYMAISLPTILSVDAEISIATLKDLYSVGENIGLTDPPQAGVVNNNPTVSSSVSKSVNNNFEALGNTKTANYDSVNDYKINGYIVELTESPILKKKIEIEKQMEINQNFDKMVGVDEENNLFPPVPESITAKINEQKILIKAQQTNVKNEINRVLSGSNKGAKVAMGKEFKNSFNGFTVNITSDKVDQIKKINGVKNVYPNYEVKAVLMDSVPKINADDVWELDIEGNNCLESEKPCLTGEGITIAIIDTGIDYTHSDLGGCFGSSCKIIGGYDYVNNDQNPMDDHGHGTHCAGIAAGNGTLKGVAPDATLYAYKVLDNNGSGYTEWIVSGIEAAVDPNNDGNFSDMVDIISLSLGGEGNPDDPMSQAIDNAVNAGVVAVVAAGNNGSNPKTISSPGTARKAITVGASDKISNYVANFSSRGPVLWNDNYGNAKSLIKPDLIAPGIDICAAQWDSAWNDSKCFDDNHIAISGTSMATPHIAGAVALLKQKNPNWLPKEIASALYKTASNLGYIMTDQGFGEVNILDAISLANKPLIAELNMENYNISGAINILGTAKGDNFSYYEVHYYPKSYPSKWQLACRGDLQVDNGILCGNFNTIISPQSKYLFRLSVYSTDGSVYSDFSENNLDNLKITRAGNNYNYVKKNQRVFGEIKLPSYDSYKVEYSIDGNSWNQFCSGRKIVSGYLCAGDFSNLPNGVAYLRLSVYVKGKLIESSKFKIAVINELMDKWPVKSDCFGGHQLNVDTVEGKAKLFSVDSASCGSGWASWINKIMIYNIDTTYQSFSGFYKDGQLLDSIKNALYADLSVVNGNIIFPMLYQYTGMTDMNGNFFGNWPYYSGSGDFVGPASFFGDYYVATGYVFGATRNLYVYAFNKDGIMVQGYPILVNDDPIYNQWITRGLGPIIINHDGENYFGILFELNIAEEKRKLYLDIYSISGGRRIKRVLIHDSGDKLLRYESQDVISADLNNDGNSEIIVGFGTGDVNGINQDWYTPGNYKSYLKIIDFDGNIILDTLYTENYLLHNLRLINSGNTSPNIVFLLAETFGSNYLGSRLASINYKGEKVFDIEVGHIDKIPGGLSIGDVTGDGQPDILLANRPRFWVESVPTNILIYSSKGLLEKELIIPAFGVVELVYDSSDILITDFNQDGKTDIIMKTSSLVEPYMNKSLIFVFETGKPYDPKTMDWPMADHDPQNTSCYNCKLGSPRPQSKIKNNSAESLDVALNVYIEKYDGTNLTNKLNVLENYPVQVASGQQFGIDTVVNPRNFYLKEIGQYRITAELKDAFGNQVLNLNKEPIIAFYDFEVK